MSSMTAPRATHFGVTPRPGGGAVSMRDSMVDGGLLLSFFSCQVSVTLNGIIVTCGKRHSAPFESADGTIECLILLCTFN
jgi:hypothetical protein